MTVAGTFFDAASGQPPPRTQTALDWLNFFLAGMLTGFGPFVALHLAEQQWRQEDIGFVLTAGGMAALLSQLPGGELLDRIREKCHLVGIGVAMIAVGAFIFAFQPRFPLVLAAEILQGLTGGILGPAIAAISLGLVGHAALAERLGRNQRFASMGGVGAAAFMGFVGYVLSTRFIFVATAALAVPTLLMLVQISTAHIHFGRSCGATEALDPADHGHAKPVRLARSVLWKDRRLLVFTTCLVLFQFANSSMLPLLGENLAQGEGREATLVLSALIIVPQIIVALCAPWVGRHAEDWGRRVLFLIGLGTLPVRAVLVMVITDPLELVFLQILDGVSGATLGVLTALIIADLTQGTGRFNLAQGIVGTFSGIGASLSTSITGIIVEHFGRSAGFLTMAGVGLAALLLAWRFMPETKPTKAIA